MPLLHYGLIENGFSIGERMGLTAADRVFVAVPLFWAYGAANALQTTLTHGATLVLQPAFEPQGALDLIEEHRCTAIYTLPNMTAALLGGVFATTLLMSGISAFLSLGRLRRADPAEIF